MSSSAPKAPIWTKSFISNFLINFFIFLTFYALLTALPIYVIEDLNKTNAEAGLVITVFMLSAILVRPIWGRVLERFGKKLCLVIGMILFMLTTIVYIWVDQFTGLLILRFIHGISFSLITTATGAIAADIIPKVRRGEGLGYHAMSMNLAVVFGPFLALTLLQFTTFTMLFMIFSVIAVAGVIFSLLIKIEHIEVPARKFTASDLFEKTVIPIALIGGLVAFSYSGIISFISIYAKSIGLAGTASYFFVVFAVVMLLSRPFVGRLFDRRGAAIVMIPSFIIFAAGMLMLSFTDTSWMLLVSGALIGLGYGSLVPCFQTLAIQKAHPARSGHATSTFFTFFDIGIAFGSYILGMFAADLGLSSLYLYASGLIIVTLLIFTAVTRKKQSNYVPKQHVS
ncbi:MFS transporter [Metabacillus sp. KIGAM252]|uniref:MFS transporter n=1 Tax=Metabacillus flavus TaxID=2823519 RepID=A0ABS5LB75_9BACI|nr:MFS transporter [Metabacillus flavus]MBS2967714.1 MFS transporter [Metabacillus flavus]